jgi:osmotically-inducible protein OsmY
MKTNIELQADITDAIRWEPLLKETNIHAEACDGVVTLSGNVGSYLKKSLAEDTAKKIAGVKAIVEKIKVVINREDEKSDTDIAIAVLHAIKENSNIPFDRIQIEVEDGHVTLNGKVQWNYEKLAAQHAASNLEGIKVLTNHIVVEPDSPDEIEKAEIEQAIERNWAMNNLDVRVYVTGHKVVLNGTVHSFYQKEEAERMSWNAPGVRSVVNELAIDFSEQ